MISASRRCAWIGLLVSLSLAGCAGTSHAPESDAQPAAAAPPPMVGSPFSEGASGSAYGIPLFIDRSDVRLGTTVQYRGRIPNASELHDLTSVPGFSRLILSFDAWPRDYAPLQPLNQTPEGIEVVVVLPGWPPTLAAVDAWNYLQIPVRAIVIVPGPPPSIDAVTSLNSMRALERVVAQMNEPTRAGFERLQRPLSFRKIVE